MTAVPGSIVFNNFNVGSVDMLNPNLVQFNSLDIYEDITKPIFSAQAEVLDYNDVMGNFMITGKEPVNISFSVPGTQGASFDMVLFDCQNLDDQTKQMSGSGKYKTYSLSMASIDVMMNRIKRLSKSYNQPTSEIVQDAWSTITNAPVNTPDPTNGNQRVISNNQAVFDFLAGIHERHVSQKFKSSLYTLFASRSGGGENRNFATYEYLMTQGAIFNLLQDYTTSGRSLTTNTAMNQLLWFLPSQVWNTPYRWNSSSNEGRYNIATGIWQGVTNKINEFVILGQESMSSEEMALVNGVADNQKPYRHTHIDPHNDKDKTGISEAKTNRANYLKDLMQNTINFEINGNPNLAVGNVVNLYIPKKADVQDGTEALINGPVLLTKIRHKINPFSASPRYTMVCEAIKAAFDEGVS